MIVDRTGRTQALADGGRRRRARSRARRLERPDRFEACWRGRDRVDGDRLWAVEDCRHVTRGLEQTLLERGRAAGAGAAEVDRAAASRGRTRGKSDSDRRARRRPGGAAGAAARRAACRRGDAARAEAARRSPRRPVAERRRCQQRLRWHLHELDPRCRCRWVRSTAPSGSTGSPGKLARRELTTQVRIARDLLGRCRSADPLDRRARPRAARR